MATASSSQSAASFFSSPPTLPSRLTVQQTSPPTDSNKTNLNKTNPNKTNSNKVVTVVLPEPATFHLFGTVRRRIASVTSPTVALGPEIVHIDVGKEPVRRFTVHQSPLVAGSRFMRMALNKDWKEAGERVVPLPDDEPGVFDTYQGWLYWKRIFGQSVGTGLFQKHDPDYVHLVKCYVLGEKILDPDFKDAVIDAIIDLLREKRVFNTGLADLVYNNTPPRSHLRMLWRDIYTCVVNPTWVDVKEPEEALHVEFMMDIATKSMTFWRANFRDEPVSRKAAFFPGEDTCAYHEHVCGVCYAAMGY